MHDQERRAMYFEEKENRDADGVLIFWRLPVHRGTLGAQYLAGRRSLPLVCLPRVVSHRADSCAVPCLGRQPLRPAESE